MEFWRKILIISILAILLYVLFRLLIRRIQLLNKPESLREGLVSEKYTDSYVNSLQSGNTTSVTSMKPFSNVNITKNNGVKDTVTALKLRQYCIKSSFNTAYNGTNVSLDMINYVLSRGCRFLDFEVYWLQPTAGANTNSATLQACVSWSTDLYVPSTNAISLSDVFNTIIANGYTTNVSDPIFIQLRPKVKKPTTADTDESSSADNRAQLYSSMAGSITSILDPFRFAGKITVDNPITELCGSNAVTKGKIVIVMDTTNNSEYAQLSDALNTVVNIDNNSTIMKTYTSAALQNMKSAPVGLNADNYSAKVTSLKQEIPMDGNARVYGGNVDYTNFITNYSCQITPMLFNTNDVYLSNYEKMFNDLGCAIVPLSRASAKSKETDIDLKSVYP